MSTISLTVAGTDITSAVVYKTARFISQVNGQPGDGAFRVRDQAGSMAFVPGEEIVLTIDGSVAWRGFIMTVKRAYAFPDRQTIPERFWDITASDINILFTKRIVFNQTIPTNVAGTLFPVNTADTTAITELFTHWLSLVGDGIDTTSDVTNVANINVDQEGRAWEAADTFGQAMASIASIPAAIFYIDPDKHFVYVDTDTPTASLALSDQPDHTTSVGYRDQEILFDGGKLANDVMIWGAGYGSSERVFTRLTDATSQTTHGLWQYGRLATGVYKQATVDRIADSYLNGSPAHHRGHKDDALYVTVSTYTPGFRCAQKITFTSNAFGFSDVIPVRKMEITFESPSHPKYMLTLSHEIDLAFDSIDPFFINLGKLPQPHVILPPPIILPGGCVCGITDSFTRTVAFSGWGTSDAGIQWGGLGTLGTGDGGSVDGSRGLIQNGTVPSGFGGNQYFGSIAQMALTPSYGNLDLYVEFQLDHVHVGSGFPDQPTGLEIRFASSGLYVSIFPNVLEIGNNFGGTDYTMPIGLGTVVYAVRIHSETSGGQTHSEAKIWELSSSEPGWLVSYDSLDRFGDPVDDRPYDECWLSLGNAVYPYDTPNKVWYDNLEITGVDKCTEFRFDNFNRVVSGGWGTSDFGTAWVIGNPADNSMFSVNGSNGLIAHDSGSPSMTVSGASDPWRQTIWTMTSLFSVGSMSAGQSDFLVFSLGTVGRLLDIRLANDGTGYVELDFDGSAQSTIAFASGSSYYVKWYYEQLTGVSKGKVWSSTDSEPNWQIALTGSPPFDAPSSFTVNLQSKNPSSGFTYTHSVDYIDFDYAGKPCFQDCVGSNTTIDNFNRTTTPSGAGNDGLGTSTYGFAWNTQLGSGATPVYGCNGTKAYFDLSTCDDFRSFSGVLSPDLISGPYIIETVFSYNTNLVGTQIATFILSTQNTATLDNGAASVEIDMSADSGSSGIFIQSGLSGGTFVSIPVAPAANTDIHVKWDVQENDHNRVRVWWSGSEPSSWTVSIAGPIAPAGGRDELAFDVNEQIGYAGIMYVDYIQSDQVCTPVPPGSGTALSPGPTGQFCEAPTKITSATYQTTYSFVYNSTELWVGGAIQIRGTDYTESSTNDRFINLTAPVPTGTDVRVCYQVNGSTL